MNITDHAGLPSPPRSSQDAIASSNPSSPLRPLKRKAKPTVTPRSFRRFFTPRNATDPILSDVLTRDALVDITDKGANTRRSSPGPANIQQKPSVFDEDENPPSGSNILNHKVYACVTPDSSPDRWLTTHQYKSLKRKREVPNQRLHAIPPKHTNLQRSLTRPRSSVVRSQYRSELGAISMRELGLSREIYQRLDGHTSTPWQSQVADFCSIPEDVHVSTDLTQLGSTLALPFCVTSCHSNPLVAVGDEEGCVRLLDTEKGGAARLRKPFLAFQPHENAILDMDFSPDDFYLATASGDQRSAVIDVRTQQSIYTLRGHASTVKQVRFKPDTGHNVIATSSRDGSVLIWDLRCKGVLDTSPRITIRIGGAAPSRTNQHSTHTYAACVGRIKQTHLDSLGPYGNNSSRPLKRTLNATIQSMRKGTQLSRNEVSVTSLSFISASRPHLLLTGSDTNATVKLWDLRAKQVSHGNRWLALSSTRQPEAHGQHRKFGLTSMSISGDNSRLYTLCKDHSVYVYSVNHLLLGTAPEMYPTSTWKRELEQKEGLGPLYAFRHPKLKASSFYIKSALRPAFAQGPEILAVGSTESCAVLFPTDELHLKQRVSQTVPKVNCSSPLTPAETPTPELVNKSGDSERESHDFQKTSGVKVHQTGTALTRGHEKEVTALTWNSMGELVTVSDDMTCRVWRESGDKARELRTEGETGGSRWMHGWADLPSQASQWDELE